MFRIVSALVPALVFIVLIPASAMAQTANRAAPGRAGVSYRSFRSLTGYIPSDKWLGVETGLFYGGNEHTDRQLYGTFTASLMLNGRLLIRAGERDYSDKAAKAPVAVDVLFNAHHSERWDIGLGLSAVTINSTLSEGNVLSFFAVATLNVDGFVFVSLTAGPAFPSSGGLGFQGGLALEGDITRHLSLILEASGAGGERVSYSWAFGGLRYTGGIFTADAAYGSNGNGPGVLLGAGVTI